MKHLSIIFAAFTMGTAPIIPQAPILTVPASTATQPTQSQSLGIDSIHSIRQAYDRGDFDQFFKEMDDSYQEAKEKNGLNSLAQMRIGFTPEWQEWETRAQKLQQEKSKALLDAVQGQKKTIFVEKVESATANLSNPEKHKAIERMAMFRQMIPGQGTTKDENNLIDLDLEYEYKAIHLDLPGVRGVEKREKHCALKMEKLDRLQQMAKEFQDESLKKTVALYAEDFDARLAQSWDLADLNALSLGKTKPTNALEEQVSSILNLYQEKFSDLTRNFIAENESSTNAS